MIIVSRRLLSLLTGKFAVSITLWPFIILRSPHQVHDCVLINHERIHLRQQVELLLLFFYIWYGLEYIYHRLNKHNHLSAYHKLCFEKEAFANESNQDYLKNRRIFSYLQYFNSNN